MSYCRHALRLRACSRGAPTARLALVSRPLSSTSTIPVAQTKPPPRPRAAEPAPQGSGAVVKGGAAAAAGGTGGGEKDEAEVAAAMKRLSEK